MADIHLIEDETAADALAGLLNGHGRRRPVVVVTISAGRADPWIDAERIADEVGALAEVYLMPTGPASRTFADLMAPGTQVYGGAGRVYPVGHEWVNDLARSPLHFAFGAEDRDRATDRLISDALRMAAAGGLHSSTPARQLPQVEGVVRLTVARRALVDIGRAMPATVVEELTVDGVPIERLVRVGQRVRGRFDAAANRVDLRGSLRPAADALAGYRVGDVVLARVSSVSPDRAELVLYPATSGPQVAVMVARAGVTADPGGDLGALLTVAEVVPARLTGIAPSWSLVLTDVMDDDPVVAAPALLAGGPPWLVAEVEEREAEQPVEPPPPVPAPRPAEPTSAEPTPAEPSPPRPSPAIFDRSRPPPPPATPPPANPLPPPPAPAPARSETTRALLLKIDGLTARVSALERDREAAADEREQLRYLLGEEERRANRAENEVRAARTRLRKAGRARPTGEDEGPRFADPEQGFRYLVLTRWATRTLPAEQSGRPLPHYRVGPRFLRSLDDLAGIRSEKVADVVVEIVTGMAPQLPGREVHRLRAGRGPEEPFRVREDGATCWRASLQVNSPSARRIHYWLLPDGTVELAQVATHDDMDT